jgi:DNA invertase Pin-like site-specific DNA recombinase
MRSDREGIRDVRLTASRNPSCRDIRISERVHAGLAKARKQGRIGGRPRLVLDYRKIHALHQEGSTVREIAEEMGISPASVHRIVKEHHRQPGVIVPV